MVGRADLKPIKAMEHGTHSCPYDVKQIVLCGGDRSAYVLDGCVLKYLTLPELD